MAIGLVWASILLCVLATVLYFDKMGVFKSKNHFPVEGRTILVTGGSQGMGKGIAQLLAGKGANVLIVARNIEKLESALEDIKKSARDPSVQRFYFISADLSNPRSAASAIDQATTWNNGLPPDSVICCAGVAHLGFFVDFDPAVLQEQMGTNYFSAAYTAHAVAKAWLAHPPTPRKSPMALEPRHIVFTSSLVAFLPFTGYSAYTTAKCALRALSETLSQEFLLYEDHSPMRSHCVFPGTIFGAGLDTENTLKPEITKQLEEGDDGQTPEQVAAATIKKLESGDEIITVNGWIGKAMKSGSLGGSKRSGYGILEWMMSWATTVILAFVRREMDGKVRAWGSRKNMGKIKLDKMQGSE